MVEIFYYSRITELRFVHFRELSPLAVMHVSIFFLYALKCFRNSLWECVRVLCCMPLYMMHIVKIDFHPETLYFYKQKGHKKQYLLNRMSVS
jgi:hypothetical protein